jgi:hypothetical protein
MDMFRYWRVAAAAVLTVGASLALSSCVLSPGAFESTLDLRRDGHFTFTYDGEIHLLALSRLAEMSNAADDGDDFV